MDIHERLEGKCFPSEIDMAIREHLKEVGYFVDNSDYMEFIDDIATQITIQRFGEDTYAPSSEVGQEHVMMFQEDAQDFYNEQYDWVETMLNITLKVYSDEQ
jgi:hypothetical protein|tara:strand:- start:21 stop:326 length:306 start_codon:yes stop_codon:yes gene_type:complete